MIELFEADVTVPIQVGLLDDSSGHFWFQTKLLIEEVLECLICDDAVALRVHFLPIIPHHVLEEIRFRAARVKYIISSALSMILDEFAEVFEAHMVPEVFVHDHKLCPATSITQAPNALHS